MRVAPCKSTHNGLGSSSISYILRTLLSMQRDHLLVRLIRRITEPAPVLHQRPPLVEIVGPQVRSLGSVPVMMGERQLREMRAVFGDRLGRPVPEGAPETVRGQKLSGVARVRHRFYELLDGHDIDRAPTTESGEHPPIVLATLLSQHSDRLLRQRYPVLHLSMLVSFHPRRRDRPQRHAEIDFAPFRFLSFAGARCSQNLKFQCCCDASMLAVVGRAVSEDHRAAGP